MRAAAAAGGEHHTGGALIKKLSVYHLYTYACISAHAPPPTFDHTEQDTAFFDMVAGIQGSRMNDQRAQMPAFPGLHNQEAVIGPLVGGTTAAAGGAGPRARTGAAASNLDDQFFEMLMRCQVCVCACAVRSITPLLPPPFLVDLSNVLNIHNVYRKIFCGYEFAYCI